MCYEIVWGKVLVIYGLKWKNKKVLRDKIQFVTCNIRFFSICTNLLIFNNSFRSKNSSYFWYYFLWHKRSFSFKSIFNIFQSSYCFSNMNFNCLQNIFYNIIFFHLSFRSCRLILCFFQQNRDDKLRSSMNESLYNLL